MPFWKKKEKKEVAEARQGMEESKKYEETSSINNFAKYELDYLNDGVIFGIINLLADSIMETGFEIVCENKKNEKIIIDYADEINLIDEMNIISRDLNIFGNCFRTRDRNFETLNIKKLRISDENGIVKKIIYDEKKEFQPNQLIHFKLNKYGNNFYGVSPIKSCQRITDMKRDIETDMAFWVRRNAGQIRLWLLGEKGQKISQNAIDNFTELLSKPALGRDIVYENIVDLKTTGAENVALRVDNYLQYLNTQIFMSFGFGSSFFEAKTSTEATAKVQMTMLERKLNMIQKIIGKEIETKLFRTIIAENVLEGKVKIPDVPKIVFNPFSEEEMKTKVEWLLQLLNAGIITKEDVKKEIG